MAFRSGSFVSNAIVTPRDRQLEAAINRRLPHGSVALFTVREDGNETYGMIYTLRSLSKTIMRQQHDLDVRDIVDALTITSFSMQNVRLPASYSYDEDDANKLPDWAEDLKNASA